MLKAIGEMGVFIVIAQAILYFVPGEAYVKYVKVMIGIIMIAQMLGPLLSFVTQGEWEQIAFQSEQLWEELSWETENLKTGENEMGIYDSIEEELKNRLRNNPPAGYEVLSVSLKEQNMEEKEPGSVVVTLRKQEGAEAGTETGVDKVKIDRIDIEEPEKEITEENGITEEAQKEAESIEGDIRNHCGMVLGVMQERITILISK